MMLAHLRFELLAGFGLLIGYFGRALWRMFQSGVTGESAVLRRTLIEHVMVYQDAMHALCSAPYHLGDSKLQQHQGICPDCGGVTEMYERHGESQWPAAWVEYCTGCGNMVERPKQGGLWAYAGKISK